MKKKPILAIIGGSGLYNLEGLNKSKLTTPSTPLWKTFRKNINCKI